MTARHDHSIFSRDYEREAEVTRSRLARDLDELNARLTPGQVFDEMLTYARGGGGTFFRAFSNATRQSPMSSLLIGAGVMMFLSEKVGFNRQMRRWNGDWAAGEAETDEPEFGPRPRSAASPVTDRAASGARSATESARGGVRQAAGAVRKRAADATDAVMGGAAAVGDMICDTADTGSA